MTSYGLLFYFLSKDMVITIPFESADCDFYTLIFMISDTNRFEFSLTQNQQLLNLHINWRGLRRCNTLSKEGIHTISSSHPDVWLGSGQCVCTARSGSGGLVHWGMSHLLALDSTDLSQWRMVWYRPPWSQSAQIPGANIKPFLTRDLY